MSKGSSSYCHSAKYPSEPSGYQTECGQDSLNFTSNGHSETLGRSINQALQLQSGKQVTAFVLMALYDDGEVSTHTTNDTDVQHCSNTIFTSVAKQRMRLIHRKPALQAARSHGPQDHHDVLFPRRFENRHSQQSHQIGHFDQSPEAQRITAPNSSHGSTPTHSSVNDCPRNLESISPAAVPPHHANGSTRNFNPRVQLQSLMVCEGSKINKFIEKRLQLLQQLPVKRIAKAWIKGICPKKQATFPYHKKKRAREGWEHESTDIPEWWPPTTECRFVEPDHIRRDERIKLCIHLLRLRPDPADLKKWNNDSVEPHPTHVNRGWTEFLLELAPLSIFDEMRESEDKTQHRQKLLGQIYELARREEEFACGEIDATDRFYYEEEDVNPIPCQNHRRKNRRSSDISNDESDTESLADSAHLSKRVKKASQNTSPARSPALAQGRDGEKVHAAEDSKSALSDSTWTTNTGRFVPIPGNKASSPHGTWEHPQWKGDSKDPNLLRSLHHQGHLPQSVQSVPQHYAINSPWIEHSSPASYNTSIGSEAQSVCDPIAIEAPTSTFPGRHDFQFPQTSISHAQDLTHAQCSGCVPTSFSQQPFQDGLGSGIYTPAGFTNVTQEHAHVAQQPQYTPGVYQNNPESAQAQYFATTSEDSELPINAVANPNFRSYAAINDPQVNFSVDQSGGCPQPNAFPYPEFRPATDFQAPARVSRGFTGHGSGVGGGAFT